MVVLHKNTCSPNKEVENTWAASSDLLPKSAEWKEGSNLASDKQSKHYLGHGIKVYNSNK